MVRAIWKGAISFGLVNVPVRLYPAVQKRDLPLHYLHSICYTPIKYEKVCPTCRRAVPPEEIIWGYEFSRGRFVTLTKETLANLPLPTTKTIEILAFVALSDIDPLYFYKPYYLEPADQGAKAYALLRRAMEETGRIAVAKVAIRTRENLAALRVMGPALVLSTMYYPDEIQTAEELVGLKTAPPLQEQEINMAISLIENLTTRFEPSRYTNNYRRALQEVISKKIEGKEITETPVPVQAEVVDLMEALKASLAATSPRAGEPS